MKIRKHSFLLIAILCAFSNAHATNFYVDSIEYHIEYPAATEARVIGYIGHAPNLVIPSSVTYNGNTYTITQINLLGNLNIVNITLPNTITELEDGAFYKCKNLTTINLPNSITAIGSLTSTNWIGTFEESGITSIIIPNSVTHLKFYSFRYCTSLQSVVLPEDLDIPKECFRGCTSLSSIETNANIGEDAFRGCTNLVSAVVGGKVSKTCFWGCTNLQYASFHDVDYSGVNMSNSYGIFYGCTNLKVVNVGYTYRLGDEMFYNCCNIDTIIALRPTPVLGECFSSGCISHDSTVIVVPCGCSGDYAQEGAFRYFWNIVEDCSTEYTVTCLANNPTRGNVSGGGQYVVGSTATLTAIPNSGYSFSRWIKDDNNSQYYSNNPLSIAVYENATYTAIFEATSSIGNTETNDIRIYSERGRILVEGVYDEVVVYDIMGRMVTTSQDVGKEILVPQDGVYMVKVGTLPAKKVVVKR